MIDTGGEIQNGLMGIWSEAHFNHNFYVLGIPLDQESRMDYKIDVLE
jgi:hypothetical protein